MNTKEKGFTDYLNNYNDVSSNLKDFLFIIEKTEGQKKFAKDELICSIKQDIKRVCQPEFNWEMNRCPFTKIKKLSLFNFQAKTNLDYLAEVIFCLLTDSQSVIGLEHYIIPRQNRKEGRDFYNKWFEDFVKIKELFRVEIREASDVKVGYAIEFYIP